MWDGEYAVGLQHLKSYDYLPAECEQIKEISDRINRLYSRGLEEGAEVFGDAGEAESGLFDSFGKEIVEGSGVGN